MFSRFKKPEGAPGRPAATAPVTQATPSARPAAGATAPKAMTGGRAAGGAVVRPAAEVAAQDKEKKRKDRMQELKTELHKRLLDNLNLAALERPPRPA